MGKKISISLFCLIACLFVSGEVTAKSTYFKEPYRIEQVRVNAPQTKVYLTGNQADGLGEYGGQISGDEGEFTLTEMSCESFDKAKEGIHWVVLLDDSRSVEERQFRRVKKELIRLRRQLGSEDSMSVYTVGAAKASGKCHTVLESVSGKKGTTRDIKKLSSLQRNKKKTVLYRTITTKLHKLNNRGERTVMLLVTDGEDDSQGLYNHTYEVNDAVEEATIPVYGVLLRNVLSASSRNTAKIRNTEQNVLGDRMKKNASGYCGVTCRNEKSVVREFRRIVQIVKKQTFVLTMEAPDNRENANARLTLSLPDGSSLTKTVEYTTHTPDTDAPKVESVTEIDGHTLQVVITDATSEVSGATEKENYTVQSKDAVYAVKKVEKKQKDTYVLHMETTLPNGKCQLACANITDTSAESAEHVISQTVEFQVTKGSNPVVLKIKSLGKDYWWALLAIVLVVVGVILFLALKKRGGKETRIIEDIREEPVSRTVRLVVTDRFGHVSEQYLTVDGSAFVGRSKICNVVLDDDLLSKQQFVIETTKKGNYISDLDSTNGTRVNGIRLKQRRMLADGDEITAGRETIIFHTCVENEPETGR